MQVRDTRYKKGRHIKASLTVAIDHLAAFFLKMTHSAADRIPWFGGDY